MDKSSAMGRGRGAGCQPAPHLNAVVLAILAVLLAAAPASAHDLNVFAYVEGTTIHGTAYFRGGSPAQNVQVIARDPTGKELARTTTDEQGKFSLEARARCDHVIEVETGDGHGKSYKLRAEELPDSLSGAGVNGDSSPPPGAPKTNPVVAKSGALAVSDSAVAKDPLGPQVDAIQREVVELRKQLSDYEQTIRFRDVLGSIGYIVGVTGVLYYLLGKKNSRAKTTQGREL